MLPTFEHVRVEFVPKNTNSILQRLDLGIIACLKMRFEQKVLQNAGDLIDSGHSENLYEVDFRLASIWVYDIWERLEKDIIYNFCSKSETASFNLNFFMCI